LELGDRLAATPAPGAHVLVHCHMGISRSTAAVVILLAQQNPGAEREAFAELRRLRPFSWPNSRMIAMADDLLGRGGALIEALHPHRHEALERHPGMADPAVRIGREHELPAGYARGSLGPCDCGAPAARAWSCRPDRKEKRQ